MHLIGNSLWMFFSVVGLMLVNWGIEARKWQLAIRRIQPIPFQKALKAIFTGTTLAFFTPNRMGEYMGRILYIEKGKRIQAVSLTIVCSMAQLLVTLSAGLVGLVFMKNTIVANSESASIDSWLDSFHLCDCHKCAAFDTVVISG